MYSYETRVLHIDKTIDKQYYDWLLNSRNHAGFTCFPPLNDDNNFVVAVESGTFERMMKHFDIEWLSDTERQSTTNKIIFKKADEIKRLEAEVERLTNLIIEGGK